MLKQTTVVHHLIDTEMFSTVKKLLSHLSTVDVYIVIQYFDGMLNPLRLLYRTARSSRGGFTLVELLVVIGIIAILAGVALGPITNGIKKAKQSSGMQTTRTLAVAEFAFSNDNNGAYPDTANQSGGSGTAAAAVAQPLIAGGYTSDPSIYYISGGTAVKYTGSTAATSIAAGNIPDQCPVCWSSVAVGGGTEPTLTTAAGTEITAKPAAGNPFGIAGMAVAYKSNSSKFVIYNTSSSDCTLVDQSWAGGTPTGAAPLLGGG
jgi:prepilin-type N-terminal cleavage/methylation domain-containing protein